jgi:hypothetical protein
MTRSLVVENIGVMRTGTPIFSTARPLTQTLWVGKITALCAKGQGKNIVQYIFVRIWSDLYQGKIMDNNI